MEKLTPKEACRAFCKQCLGLTQWLGKVVDDCQGDLALNGACPLYPYRMGRRVGVKTLRAYCLYCMGGNRDDVRDCETESCEFHAYRFGTNPAFAGRPGRVQNFLHHGRC
jgi:hypothetical protein